MGPKYTFSLNHRGRPFFHWRHVFWAWKRQNFGHMTKIWFPRPFFLPNHGFDPQNMTKMQYLKNEWSGEAAWPLILYRNLMFLLVFDIMFTHYSKRNGLNWHFGWKWLKYVRNQYIVNCWSYDFNRSHILTRRLTFLLVFDIMFTLWTNRNGLNWHFGWKWLK